MSQWLGFTLGFCAGIVTVFLALFLVSLWLSRPAPDSVNLEPCPVPRTRH